MPIPRFSAVLTHPSRSRRRARAFPVVLGVLLVAGLGVLPTSVAMAGTDTLLVVNEGIGGVKLGQTPQQVKKAVGLPAGGKSATKSQYWDYDNKPPYAQVGFGNDKRVDFITPNSSRDRTGQGIGEGSSLSALQQAYPNADCTTQIGNGQVTELGCDVKKQLPDGKTLSTNFLFGTVDGSGGVITIYIAEF